MKRARILVVQDGASGAAHLEERLRGLGYTVCASVPAAPQAVEEAAGMHPDLALIDLGPEGRVHGLEAAERIGSGFNVPVVLLADGDGESLFQRAWTAPPYSCVPKPFEERQLHWNIQTALSLHERERRHRETESGLERTVAELRERIDLLQSIFDSMKEGVFANDETGKRLLANTSALEVAGFDEPGDISQWAEQYGIFLLDGETFLPVDQNPLVLAMGGQPTEWLELFVRNPQRPEGIYVGVTGQPLEGKSHGFSGGVVVFRDITETKAMQTRLQETLNELVGYKELMDAVFASMEEGLVVVDKNARILFYNASAVRIGGDRPTTDRVDEWAALHGIYRPDKKTLLPVNENPLVLAMRGQPTHEAELFVRNGENPDGLFVRVNGQPLKNKDGERGGGIVVFQDITEKKQTEIHIGQTLNHLREQSELTQAILESIQDGIIVSDDSGKFLYANPSAHQILGEAYAARADGKWPEKTEQIYYYSDRETPINNDELPLPRAIFKGESTDDMDLFVPDAGESGEGAFVRVSGRPLRNDAGKIRGGVIIFRDVTRQVLADQALAQAFTQGRLEILDTVLHNVGNAINSVAVGVETVHRSIAEDRLVRRIDALADALRAHRDDWANYLENDPQGQQVIPFIIALAQDFVRANKRLAATVERVRERTRHIVDIIRTQKALGGASSNRKYTNVKEAISNATKVLQESLGRRQVRIDIDCDEAPRDILIDESRFHQMMVNLVKNSMEAIDELAESGEFEGKPRVLIRAFADGDFLNIDVSDNGIGIPPKNTRTVFAAGYTTKETGTGLGLHSAANFVIGSGGRIRMESDGVGKGATVQVSLRLPPPRETEMEVNTQMIRGRNS